MMFAYRESLEFKIKVPMSTGEINIDSITDDSFEGEVLNCPIPVLVVFSSESSGSAYLTLRQVQQVAREYEGKVKVGKVEAADNALTTRQFRIRQIPTLLFFKDGHVVDYVVGTVRKRDVRTGIRGLLDE